jgi:hypothetical protein
MQVKRMLVVMGLVASLMLPNSAGLGFAASSNEGTYSPEMQKVIDEMKRYTDEKTIIGKNLETFDTLDYVVFSPGRNSRFPCAPSVTG